MPKRKTTSGYNRRGKRSRYTQKLRFKARRRKSGFSIGYGPPDRMPMRHRYADAICMALPNANTYPYTFSCNGLFDPNITRTGHQPHYFDQMVDLGYNRYCVVGSTITLKLYYTDITLNQTAVRACMYIDDSAAVGSKATYSNMAEEKGAKVLTICPGQNPTPLVLKRSYSARKYWGVNHHLVQVLVDLSVQIQ